MIGYLPQLPALFPELSLRENLNFHASMYGLPLRRRRRINDLLDWVELQGPEARLASPNASGGMQRRLSLAATFVQDPVLAFLDEPTAGIDPILRAKFWERFRAMAGAGKSLVVTTQYVGEAGECDVVGLLSDGELLLLDTPEQPAPGGLLRGGRRRDAGTRPHRQGDPADRRVRLRGRGHRAPPGSGRSESSSTRPSKRSRTSSPQLRALELEAREVREHVVDYDEAFVRVVERHRALQAAETPSERDIMSRSDPRPGCARCTLRGGR